MSKPVINNLTVSMWSFSETPVVRINFGLSDSEADVCHISPSGIFQYASASAPNTWHDASPHATSDLTNLPSYNTSAGRSTELLWDVDTDIPDTEGDYYFRLQVIDANGESSDIVTSDVFSVDTVAPTVAMQLDSFTNQLTYAFDITTTGSPTYYRAAEISDLNLVAWHPYTDGQQISVTFSSSQQESKNIYVQVRDDYFNISEVVSGTIVYHTAAPTHTYVRLNGTITDNEYYTGIKINDDGSFIPDRNVTLDLYAEDLYDISIYIDGDVEDGQYVRQWILFRQGETVLIPTVDLILTGTDYNYDNLKQISVQFRDAAGNITQVNKSIRLNTRIFQCHHQLLRPESQDYAHAVNKVLQSGETELVTHKVMMNNVYTRKWDDIFYPLSHSYPKHSDGTIDEAACIAMHETSNANYDAVKLSNGSVYYDNEGRPVTVDWVNDGSKDYRNMESSYSDGLTYWVIDNTGYGDIDLAFEHMNIDANSYGPPFNNLSPYKGDCLVVYDASDPMATEPVYGADGKTTYVLKDTTKLKELFSFTGSGTNVMNLTTGYSMNSDSHGGFTAPTIRGINRICMILYSDAAQTSSGFKLKGGPKHVKEFVNYDVDETNGELWLHEYPNGASYSFEVRMIYDYYDTDIQFNLDEGEVLFDAQPSGVVTADYSYYLQEDDKESYDYTRLFVASIDDFVDYDEPSLYVTPSGQQICKTVNYEFGYPVPITPSGLVSSYFSIDKDRGLVSFFDGSDEYGDEFAYVPDGRLTLDYYYHTFKRLTNDGYGILTFRDKTIVADETPLFPDYTWVDVKIVNEGDASLEDGILIFTSRGYDSDGDGTIDQVLDVNRPWDIQEGTAEETYNKAAMQVTRHYTFNSKPSKAEAMSILSNWSNRAFGFDVDPRTQFYGRVVWVLGGTSGHNYPQTSVGRKTFSAEVQGKFYNIEV